MVDLQKSWIQNFFETYVILGQFCLFIGIFFYNHVNSVWYRFEKGYKVDRPLFFESSEDLKIVIWSEDALLAGSDTTGNAAAFLLLNIATNPRAQEKLFKEIKEVLGDQAQR